MSPEENKTLVRRMIEEALMRGHLDVFDEVYAPGCAWIALWPHPRKPDRLADIGGVHLQKAGTVMLPVAFPDPIVAIDALVAEGDTIVSCTTAQGTYTRGPFFDLAPTGKRVRWTSIVFSQIAGGTIVEERTLWDRLGAFQQLGVVPDQDALMPAMRSGGRDDL